LECGLLLEVGKKVDVIEGRKERRQGR
jgi:hypothetical protein